MKKQKVLGVIPARLASTRLKRKLLLTINGLPLITYTMKQVQKAKLLDAVIVATDSKEIARAVESYGGKAVMTSASIKTGSDRVAAAAKKFTAFIPDIVVNIQGDEPLIPEKAIDTVVKLLLKDSSAVMSTVATPLTDKRDLHDPGVVKVVCDGRGNALYFSRSLIPNPRAPYHKYLKHIGLYAFRRKFLYTYVRLLQTELEKAELLEQLRALENGYSIKVGVGKFDRVEVNTKEEFERVKRIITQNL